MMHAYAGVAFALLAFAAHGQPSYDTAQLSAHCRAWLDEVPAPLTSTAAVSCYAFSVGVLEGLMNAEIASPGNRRYVCPPAGVSMNDAVFVGVKEVMKARPRAAPASAVLTEAFIGAYPCK